jgi:hypothetical protein
MYLLLRFDIARLMFFAPDRSVLDLFIFFVLSLVFPWETFTPRSAEIAGTLISWDGTPRSLSAL